jgi:hypothetical protein
MIHEKVNRRRKRENELQQDTEVSYLDETLAQQGIQREQSQECNSRSIEPPIAAGRHRMGTLF